MVKNYYQLLELAWFSDMDQVKGAYRQMARRYHPDLNKDDPTAEERFKAINEAYEVLSNPTRKQLYDDSLKAVKGAPKPPPPQGPAPAPPPPPSPPPPKAPKSELHELFEAFIKRPGRKPKRGEDVTVEALISPQEAEAGTVKTVNVEHHEVCRRCAGTGRFQGSVCTACNGEKQFVRLKKIDVRIPPGVKQGSKVRIAKEGGRGLDGGDPGDLYLKVKISYDSNLRIDGVTVHCDLSVSVLDAVLGGEVEVPTIRGPVKMTIPPLTSSGATFRLKEAGVQNGSSRGDQWVTVKLVPPEKLTPQEKQLYEQLRGLQGK
jgi:DnaJ-class molecular chaperone